MAEATGNESEPQINQFKSIGAGFGKGIAMVIGTLVAATAGHSVGVLLGVSPPLAEGLAGGLALAAMGWFFFMNDDGDELPRLDIPDTRVPDKIADNPTMTVVSNPPNGSGVAVWDKEDGVAILTFVGEEILEKIWLDNDEKIQAVIDEMEAAR